MRLNSILLIIICLLPGWLSAETLFLKDGTEIETNYYWKEGISRVGYFTNDGEKYIDYDLVDWEIIKKRKNKYKKSYQSKPAKPEQKAKKTHGSYSNMHKKYQGDSDDVINLSKPDDGPAILYISGNRSESHFAVAGYNASGQRTKLLVNTTGSYDGAVLIDILSGVKTSQLEIKASSEWRITVFPLKDARRFNCPGEFKGNGDEVLIVTGAEGLMNIYGNAAGDHFAAISYSASGKRLLVNTTEKYSGRVRVPKETFIMEIKAVGPWIVET